MNKCKVKQEKLASNLIKKMTIPVAPTSLPIEMRLSA